jgi:hypothetical protein
MSEGNEDITRLVARGEFTAMSTLKCLRFIPRVRIVIGWRCVSSLVLSFLLVLAAGEALSPDDVCSSGISPS